MANTNHTINYRLHKSKFLEGKERNLVASVVTNKTQQLGHIAQRMRDEGCPVMPRTIEEVLGFFGDMVVKVLAEGDRINVKGLFQLYPVIKGTFKAGEGFNKTENALSVGACSGSILKAAIKAVGTHMLGEDYQPIITDIWDAVSDLKGKVEADHLISIYGKNLKTDAGDRETGLYIYPVGKPTEVTHITITANLGDEILFTMPEVAYEDAVMSVRTRDPLSKEILVATYPVKVILPAIG